MWLEATRRLKQHFGDEIYLRGNCDQLPFSLASMVRSTEEWMMDLLDEENSPLVEGLLDYCTEASTQFIRLMVTTGAHLVSNGDSPAGPDMISPRLFRRFALPYEKRVIDVAHQEGMPYFLHICGKVDRILDDMLASGADGLELDFKTDVHLAHDRMHDRAVFIGNLDPSGVLARGTPDLVEQKTRELLEVFADTPRFILNAGCAMPSDTPPENLRTMIRVAREFSR